MITDVASIATFQDGKKIKLLIDEEDNDSRYLIEGTSSEYPYDEIEILIRRVKNTE